MGASLTRAAWHLAHQHPPHTQAQWSAVLDASVAAGLLDGAAREDLKAAAAGGGGGGGAHSGNGSADRGVGSPTAAGKAANGSAAANGAAAAAPAAPSYGGIGGAGVPAFKAALASALKEFFNSADAQEVAARCVPVGAAACCVCVCVCVCVHAVGAAALPARRCCPTAHQPSAHLHRIPFTHTRHMLRRLMELGQPGLHSLFVKQVVTLAMDRRDREREMASNLLSELHPRVITGDQVRVGVSVQAVCACGAHP
jgi:hypothetical protein